MPVFEYKVVPAPTRGLKAKGVKGTPARFANALESVMNEMGADGWEYQRTDTLPVEERQGLTGKTTNFQNMLVFRRALIDEAAEEEVAALIEDQTALAASPVAESDAETIAPQVDDVDEPEEAEMSLPPEAQERVEETLKSDGMTFPWNSRRKAASDAETTQAEAE